MIFPEDFVENSNIAKIESEIKSDMLKGATLVTIKEKYTGFIDINSNKTYCKKKYEYIPLAIAFQKIKDIIRKEMQEEKTKAKKGKYTQIHSEEPDSTDQDLKNKYKHSKTAQLLDLTILKKVDKMIQRDTKQGKEHPQPEHLQSGCCQIL